MSATQRTFLGIDDKLNIHTTWGNVPAQARPLPLRLLAECINTVVYSSKQNLIPVAAKGCESLQRSRRQRTRTRRRKVRRRKVPSLDPCGLLLFL